jgi:hypothetical protein
MEISVFSLSGAGFHVAVGNCNWLPLIWVELQHQNGGFELNESRIRNGRNPGESARMALEPGSD